MVTVNKDGLDDSVELSPYYDRLELTSGYFCLDTGDEKRLYDAVIDHAADFTEEQEDGYTLLAPFTLEDCSLSSEEISKVLFAVELDRPEFFWLANPYSYSMYDGDFEFTLKSDFTFAEYKKAVKRLNSVVNSLLAALEEDMSELERELFFHDYIVDNCKYKNKASESDFNRYNMYGCLVQGNAVCEGYTEAMQYLLSLTGVNSLIVSGSVDGSGEVDHEWNAVELDGEFYYTDVTWDDGGELARYEYFNLTTDQLLHSHSIAPLFDDYVDSEAFETDGMVSCNLIVPECTAVKYNYYRLYASTVSDIDDNSVADDLASTAAAEEKYFTLFVDDSLDFELVYDQLFSNDLFLFKNYIDEANYILGYDSLQTSVTVIKRNWLRVIIVELNYF